MYIIKRDGTHVPFDKQKIIDAINKAFIEVDGKLYENDTAISIADEIEEQVNILGHMEVEDIQDLVEACLMGSYRQDVARAYVRYRYKKEVAREHSDEFITAIGQKIRGENVQNSNANVDESSFGGRYGEAADALMKKYALEHCVSDMARKNHEGNMIYIHDLSAYPLGNHNCAEGNQWVHIRHNGQVKTITLQDLADEIGLSNNQIADLKNTTYQILSRDGWTKLVNISKRSLEEDELIYTIKTRTGLPLKLTGKHRVPVISKDGTEIIKEVADLKIGDQLLDIENLQLSIEDLSSCFLSLLDLQDDYNTDLRIINSPELKAYLKYKYGIVFAHYAKEHNFSLRANDRTMKLDDFKQLLNDYPLSFEILSRLRIKANNSKHDYPLFLNYSPQLAKLYAYIYADGGVYVNEENSTYQLTFTNTNEAIVDDFIDTYETCFGYRLNKSYATAWATSPCTRVTDSNKIVVQLFKNYAGARKYGASDLSVPNFVLNGPEEIKYAYLQASLDTDGCYNMSSISYTSCCKKYCEQLSLMLQELGYHPHVTDANKAGSKYRFGKKSGIRNFDSFKVTINRNDEKYKLMEHINSFKYKDIYSYMGLHNKYNENKIISITSEIKNNTYVYDMETETHWYIINNYISHNCLSIPFDDLLANGFNTRQVDIRPAGSINTAFQLVAVIFQLQSLQQFGGVSATHLDWTMVPYVRKSFYKHYIDGIEYIGKTLYPSNDWYMDSYSNNTPINEYCNIDDCVEIYKYAMSMTLRELEQAVEGFYHNANSLQSRSGCQLPFTSINYGTCTLPEGRMVIKALLEGSINGVGKLHKTSVFPCGIFQCMEGVNRKPGDPNYDLFQLALKSTAHRLYPNYANCNWSGNAGFDPDDPRTYFSTMGCRTSNGADINGLGLLKDGRGNICPVTIILPTLAMMAKENYEKEKCISDHSLESTFMFLLDTKIHEAKDMLIERFEYICSQNPASAKFMYENGLMAGYIPEEGIRSALRHGTLALGQLGLAEALQILIGTDHTTDKGMALAKQIEQLFKIRCAEFKETYRLNFGVYYTPRILWGA